MEKYIYEFQLGTKDFEEFSKEYQEFSICVLEIANKYKNELKERNVIFDTSHGMNIISGIVMLKPIQEDLPEAMKEELNIYFKSKSPLK